MDFTQQLANTMRTVAGRSVRSLDDLTHEQQFRVADQLGVHLTDLHATLRAHGGMQLAARMQQRTQHTASRPTAAVQRTTAPPAGRHARSSGRAFIRATEDEFWRENGRFAVTVEQLCHRAGVPLDHRDGHGTRLRKLEKQLDTLPDSPGRRSMRTELRHALAETAADSLDRDQAYTSLHRQRAAARAAR